MCYNMDILVSQVYGALPKTIYLRPPEIQTDGVDNRVSGHGCQTHAQQRSVFHTHYTVSGAPTGREVARHRPASQLQPAVTAGGYQERGRTRHEAKMDIGP